MKNRLLVLEDEPSMAQLVAETAESCGYSVTTVSDGGELDSQPLAEFDMLVIDLMMPMVDGVEVLRNVARSGVRPGIVLMSGLDRKTLDGARQVAQANGLHVCDVLQKPFRSSELRDVLIKNSGGRPRPAPVRAQGERPSISSDDVRRGLERNEFVVHFQPQVSLTDGAWQGVEALVRWQHPVHGLLFPDAFIAQTETDDLALPFAKAVLIASIRELAMLDRDGGFSGTLSVNISPRALSDYGLPETVVDALKDGRLDRSRLILEVTETSVAASEAMALDIQTRLRMRGIRLSIDDFGTGQSSLERLKDSPFDELKIDMVFVRAADTDPTARSIVENSIHLGHSLAMHVVAEGVETESTFRWLRSLGCELAQGYWIERPKPPAAITEWGRTWGAKLQPVLRGSV